jgi:hypothetical protein
MFAAPAATALTPSAPTPAVPASPPVQAMTPSAAPGVTSFAKPAEPFNPPPPSGGKAVGLKPGMLNASALRGPVGSAPAGTATLTQPATAVGPSPEIAKPSRPFKQDDPGGVTLPTNPYPPGTVKHEDVEETDRKLIEYGTKLAAYNLEDPPTTEAEYEEQYHEYLDLNAELAEIILEYKQEGIEFTVGQPSAPTPPGG